MMSAQMKQMLHLQWKASRWPMLPFALLCVGLPLMAVSTTMQAIAEPHHDPSYAASGVLDMMSGWAGMFALLSSLLGAAVALTSWTLDHRANHVYSLALPISRARYSLFKFAGGAFVVIGGGILLLIGCLIAVSVYDIPEPLSTYPFSLSLRFFIGALLVFSMVFAAAAGTIRTTIYIVVGAIIVVIFGPVLADIINTVFDTDFGTPGQLILRALTDWPGPFHVFGGSWMLIDV